MSQSLSTEIDPFNIVPRSADDSRPRSGSISGARSVCLADVSATEVAWLWPGRIALGKVTLLAGDPGLGKSMVTLDIAARVSRGAAWPEEMQSQGDQESGSQGDPLSPYSLSPCLPLCLSSSPPAGVVLLSAEDDLADTIRPRLEAHGADCSRIIAIRGITGRDEGGDYRRSFDLGRDLNLLTETIDLLENCRLVIIDPVSAYLGRAVENANAAVRSLLGPLAQLAADRQLAIVVVTHLRKEDGAALHRMMGSVAFVAAARGAWMICKDPRDAQRRLFLPVKNNLATDAGGLAYTIEPVGVDGSAVVCWSTQPVELDPDQAMREQRRRPGRAPDERAATAEWVREFLKESPRLAAEVRDHALGSGYTNATLRRAFRDLGGTAYRDDAGRWWWSLKAVAAEVA